MGMFGESGSVIYNRRSPDENEGNGLMFKIFSIGQNENPQGVLINLAIDFPMKIMNYGKHGEAKYTEKYSEFAPIQFFTMHEDYVGILCAKKYAEKAVGVINTVLVGRNGEEVLEPCSINLNNQTTQDEMRRFWVGGIQDRFSKSASVAGADLEGKSDYIRQVRTRSGILGAIILKSDNGDYEYGLSKEGIFWIRSNVLDTDREQIILDNLTNLIRMGIIT